MAYSELHLWISGLPRFHILRQPEMHWFRYLVCHPSLTMVSRKSTESTIKMERNQNNLSRMVCWWYLLHISKWFFLWGVAIHIQYNTYIYIHSYAYLYIYRYVISSDLGQTLTCFTEKNSLIGTNYNHVWWGREVGEIVLFWLVHLPLFQA